MFTPMTVLTAEATRKSMKRGPYHFLFTVAGYLLEVSFDKISFWPSPVNAISRLKGIKTIIIRIVSRVEYGKNPIKTPAKNCKRPEIVTNAVGTKKAAAHPIVVKNIRMKR